MQKTYQVNGNWYDFFWEESSATGRSSALPFVAGVIPNDILICFLEVAASAFSGQPRAFDLHNGPIQGFEHSLRTFISPIYEVANSKLGHMGLNHRSRRRRNIRSDWCSLISRRMARARRKKCQDAWYRGICKVISKRLLETRKRLAQLSALNELGG